MLFKIYRNTLKILKCEINQYISCNTIYSKYNFKYNKCILTMRYFPFLFILNIQ